MNLAERILEIYPNLSQVPGVDFWLQDDGNGPYIKEWLNANPRPTQTDLDAQALPVAKRLKRHELLLAFKADYAAIWLIDDIEVEEQKDAILAKSAAQRTANEAALVSQAGTLITKIKSKLADVRSSTTEAQVTAITWN